MADEVNKCETCFFYQPETKVGDQVLFATCRVEPPVASARPHWPVVRSNDWCGEWMVHDSKNPRSAMEHLG